MHASRTPYSWKFIVAWSAGTALGGAAGVALSRWVNSDWVVGLALGVVAGGLAAVGWRFWRERPPMTSSLPGVNARLLRWALALTALGATLYLLAGWAGVPFNLLFPWDGVGLLALCGLAEILLRRGRSFWAASCLMSGVFLPVAFNAQFYPRSLPADLPVWNELLSTRRPLVVEDVANDPRLKQRARLLAQGLQTILIVPLLLGAEVLGHFSVNCLTRRRFSADEIELAQALAQQVTLAMQLTRLAEQNQKAALLEERNRMAREIHDTLAQGFTGIVIQLEAAEDALGEPGGDVNRHLTRARDLARESLAEARRSVYALRPQPLERKPLPSALRDSITALTTDAPHSVEWQWPEQWPALPPGLEADLLRLGQEAVINALRHAGATRLRVALRARPDAVEMEVSDNGRGFDPHRLRPGAPGGFGLVGMRERAAQHGGELIVTSAPAGGTTVKCRIPTHA